MLEHTHTHRQTDRRTDKHTDTQTHTHTRKQAIVSTSSKAIPENTAPAHAWHARGLEERWGSERVARCCRFGWREPLWLCGPRLPQPAAKSTHARNAPAPLHVHVHVQPRCVDGRRVLLLPLVCGHGCGHARHATQRPCRRKHAAHGSPSAVASICCSRGSTGGTGSRG
mgnify:CR=1 FL=1